MTTSVFKMPLPRQGEEYYDAIDRIAEVLQKHFPQTDPSRLPGKADHFMAAQHSFEADFWNKDKVVPILENLPRLLAKVQALYDKIPENVKSELQLQASVHEQTAVEKFKKTRDTYFVSQLPGPDALDGLKALQVVIEHSSKIAEVFATVKRELPAGMPTNQRPGDAYSVIYAILEVCRGERTMKIPGSIDESGDFYRLLKDLFALFGITVSPKGAYKGWIKNIDNNYENMDLMPI
jgi:hypothetical protein